MDSTPMTFDSVRFGALTIDEAQVIDFPLGLIGLGGSRYTLLDRNPGSGFLWLHSVEDPALALPVIDPRSFFADFCLEMSDEDRERTGIDDLGEAGIYVTVRAMPDPREITVNLRAPLLVGPRGGFQVLNHAEGAELQTPLFSFAEERASPTEEAADAA